MKGVVIMSGRVGIGCSGGNDREGGTVIISGRRGEVCGAADGRKSGS